MTTPYKSIYICGVPGSGTTLMRRLFWAFEDCHCPETESNMETLARHVEEGKRYPEGKIVVQSGHLKKLFHFGVDYAREHDMGVLFMMRDFPSAQASNSSCTPKRYLEHYSSAIKNWEYVDLTVNFYRLLEQPNYVQDEIACMFGLTPTHHFSDYPDFCPKGEMYDKLKAKHRPRPLGAPVVLDFAAGNRAFNKGMDMFDRAMEQEKEHEV